MLKKAPLLCLAMMDEGDEELVCDGLQCWVGERQFHRKTVNALLRCMAVSDVSDVKGAERFVINGAGRAIRQRPALAGEIWAAVRAGRTFSVTDGIIVDLVAGLSALQGGD